MFDTCTADQFAAVVGQLFYVTQHQTESIALELIAVTVSAASDPAARRPFTLLFRGPRDRPFAQGMYRVEHEQLGILDGLFLTAHGPNAGGLEYAAIFN